MLTRFNARLERFFYLVGGAFFLAGDGAVLEQVLPQMAVELLIIAADPFQDHGRMLHFLLGVVQEDGLQLRTIAEVRAQR